MCFPETLDDFCTRKKQIRHNSNGILEILRQESYYVRNQKNGWIITHSNECEVDCRGWDGMDLGDCDCGNTWYGYVTDRNNDISFEKY